MSIISHNEFYALANVMSKEAVSHSINVDRLVRGSIELYFKHNFNTGYLNKTLQVARHYKKGGMRVNAVKACLAHFTGAKFEKHQFTKRGKLDQANTWLDSEGVQRTFESMESWIDFADTKTPEPVYDAVKEAQAIEKYLERRIAIARENNACELADRLSAMLKVA